jgi:hypothetical protein
MDKQAPALRGPAITTAREWYQRAGSVGLKFNITNVLSEQNIADFGAKVVADKGV